MLKLFLSLCFKFKLRSIFSWSIIFSIVTLFLIRTEVTFEIPWYFLLIFLVKMEQRSISQIYKQLDSEIKQILFEEETGYKPIVKGKLSFKYEAWLMLNERKRGNYLF